MHAQQNDTQTSHLNWAGAHLSDLLAIKNHHQDHLKYPPKATNQWHLPKAEKQRLNFNTTYHFTQSAQSASLHITLPLRKSEAPHTLSGVARRFFSRNSASCRWRDSWVYEKDWEGMQSMLFYLGPWLAAGSRTSFSNFSQAWDLWEASAVWTASETTSPYLPALRTLIYMRFWLEACFRNLLESFARRHFPNSQPFQSLLASACSHSGSSYIHSWCPGIGSAAGNPEGPPSFGDWMAEQSWNSPYPFPNPNAQVFLRRCNVGMRG